MPTSGPVVGSVVDDVVDSIVDEVIGVWLRASTHTIAPSAASWSGQPSPILSTPRTATAVSGSIDPELPASQIGPCTTTRSRHGSTSSHVSRVHSFTTCRSWCHPVASPVTLPTMKPTIGQPMRHVSASTTV